MTIRICVRALFVALCASIALAASAQLNLGRKDDFEDGTTMDWSGGANPINIPDGGPMGAGDAFMQLESHGGAGPGSKLAAYNLTSWFGNFASIGVRKINVDLRNQGATALDMRIVLFGSNGDRWNSTVAQHLEPGTWWVNATFVLSASTMNRVAGFGTFDEAFVSIERTMLRHSTSSNSSGGTPVVAQLGVDNVSARPGDPVTPSSFSVFRGVLESGGIPQLATSDDSYVIIRNGITALRTESPITLIVDGTAASSTLTSLTCTVENKVSITGLTQRIDLFDFVAGQYENESTQSATTTDSVVTVNASNPGRFLESGTRDLRARLRIRADGPVFTNTWRSFTDQMIWNTLP